MNKLITLFVCILLSGCASNSQTLTSAWLKRDVKVRLPAVTLSHDINKQQLLTAKVGNKTGSLITLLEVKDGRVVLMGLSTMGIRLFEATYDGQTIQVEKYITLLDLPPANQVLADIMLSYWPVNAWQHLLPNEWQLLDKGNKRLLIDDNQQIISEITYKQSSGEREPITIKNNYFNYFISIQDMEE